MNPALGNLGGLWTIQLLPLARRSVVTLMIVTGLTFAVPLEAQQDTGSTYGPVRRADTLWELALRFRGDSQVNAQQAMIAILRANPGAFVDGNINALRTGVTLRVPTAADMVAVSPGEAAAEFARHEEAWRNRRRTGSAAPGGVPPRPAPAPAGEAPAPEVDTAEELREARATVAELRERLSERDEAIEDLLVQLAAVRRELRGLQDAEAPASSGDSEGRDEEAAGRDEAPGASWLPVSPLILGSSLIVLLVLIVVVTLLRQRGGTEETFAEDPHDEEEEVYDRDEDGREPWERADEGAGPYGDGEEALEVERREPGPSRAGSVGAATVAAAAVATAAPDRGFPEDDDAGDHREEEAADLPIGMDLDVDERWEPEPEGAGPDRPETRDSDPTPEVSPEPSLEGPPDDPPGYGRHVEVGELDEIELEVGPASGAFPEIPADLGEEDDPPAGPGPDRPEGPRHGHRG